MLSRSRLLYQCCASPNDPKKLVMNSQGFPTRMKGVSSPKKCWPILGHVPIFAANKGNLDKSLETMHQECGKTFWCKLPGGKSMLVTADADLTRKIFLNQGADSLRQENWHWVKIFKDFGWPRDVSNETGEKWKAYRSVLNRTVGNRQSSLIFVPTVEEKSHRLSISLRKHLDETKKDADGFMPVKKGTILRRLFGMASLESSVDIFLGKRAAFLPGVEDPEYEKDTILTTEEATRIFHAMESMFRLTAEVDEHPFVTLWPEMFKCYRDERDAWKTSISLTSKMVEGSLKKFEETGKWPDEIHGQSLFPMILKAGGITNREAMFLGVESTIAAIDTTAQTTEFFVSNVAYAPKIQEELRNEIDSKCKEGKSYVKKKDAATEEQFTVADFDHKSYDEDRKFLRACVRESMRITPTIGYHSRKLTRDISFTDENGTEIFLPAGLQILINYARTCRDPMYNGGAHQPKEFDPYRFLRNQQPGSSSSSSSSNGKCPFSSSSTSSEQQQQEKKNLGGGTLQVHPHASAIPFGVGARKCAGAGIAQIFVETFAQELLSNFEIKWVGGKEGFDHIHKGISRMNVNADENLMFKPRK